MRQDHNLLDRAPRTWEGSVSDKSPESSEAEPDPGFSAAERAVGAWAAYKHPIIWSVVANEMLESETSPAADGN